MIKRYSFLCRTFVSLESKEFLRSDELITSKISLLLSNFSTFHYPSNVACTLMERN